MKQVIFIGLIGFSTITMAIPNIQPYSQTSNKYLVDGKEVEVGVATLAALNGKTVMQCKTQKSDKQFMVGGKLVAGDALAKCDVKCLSESKSGLGFKNCVK